MQRPAAMSQSGALAGHDAIEYVLQACEALAEAHVKGIVHRDLKPANLFLTHRADGSPTIKVLDFGISKAALVGGEEQALTQTSAVMGTPSYMAPEQLKSSRNVDARTDVWSLGIILHELLTGEVAFKADTVPELYVAILQSAPVSLRQRRRDARAGGAVGLSEGIGSAVSIDAVGAAFDPSGLSSVAVGAPSALGFVEGAVCAVLLARIERTTKPTPSAPACERSRPLLRRLRVVPPRRRPSPGDFPTPRCLGGPWRAMGGSAPGARSARAARSRTFRGQRRRGEWQRRAESGG